MIRVANTGISAIIEPTGKITARTPLFKRGTEIEDVAWRPVQTVYSLVGDVFAEACFLLMIAGLLAAYFRPRRMSPLEEVVAGLTSVNGRADH
jgi:apolipoprotein N-acyltransferase